MSKKHGSRAKIWHAQVIKLTKDNRPRAPAAKKGKEKDMNAVPAHILSSQQKKKGGDDFQFDLRLPAPPKEAEEQSCDKARRNKEEKL